MITLCMDTSNRFLVLALIKDDQVVGSVQEDCFKMQSEAIFPKLNELMDAAGLKPMDIDQCVITDGPGSYTGVRIAMTVAKVMCAMRSLPLYMLGTLQLYAGKETCTVLLDARGKRAYAASFENGAAVTETKAVELTELQAEIPADRKVIGDGSLIGRSDYYPDLAKRFLECRDAWKQAANVHLVRPEYLKDSEAYLLKKK